MFRCELTGLVNERRFTLPLGQTGGIRTRSKQDEISFVSLQLSRFDLKNISTKPVRDLEVKQKPQECSYKCVLTAICYIFLLFFFLTSSVGFKNMTHNGKIIHCEMFSNYKVGQKRFACCAN